ncbi:MAG TPA: PQQ-dependent sugar dehydrogenase [Candidatus Nanoarchaeia archaeon]|nr:PQQ-dependent sugar dehydrogenase [Candidatus Nanoarchaeia archaeon]
MINVILVYALPSAEPVVVRVTSYNPQTRAYTFTCTIPPTASTSRYWTIRPDTPELEASFNTNSLSINYTLAQNVLYHIGCQVQNGSTYIRGDFHLDLRSGPNTNRPNIVPLSANNFDVSLHCDPPSGVTNYNLYWHQINAHQDIQLNQFTNNQNMNVNVGTPGLWDFSCGVWDIDRQSWSQWALPIEFFQSGPAYIPSNTGCIPGEVCSYVIGNGTNSTPPPPPPPVNNTNTSNNSSSCFTKLQNIPANCTGTITQDSFNGCRNLVCSSGPDSISVLACDKPDSSNPQFFEMYLQSSSGNPPKLCLANTCMQNEGYKKSPNYPICINQTNTTVPPPPPPPPPVNNTNTTNASFCFSKIKDSPVNCNGGTIAQDTFNGCRTVLCNNGGTSLKVLGCDKPDGSPQFFELYKQMQTGSGIEICFAGICIKDNGYAKSNNYPVCTQTNSTPPPPPPPVNQSNQPPQAPTWLEPSTTVPIDTFDFHIQVFPMVDAENDTHIATDFEMYDAVTNERVWSALNKTQILYHIHNADGNFEGSLLNSGRRLLYDHDYKLRARFYENSNPVQASPWSSFRFFHTKVNSTIPPGSSSWTAKSGYSVQLVSANISVPVNIAMAPNLYTNLPFNQRPLLYVTQLYGQIGMIRNDGTYVKYADNLLNYDSFGSLPGSGETGVDGLYVDQNTGNLFASMVYADSSAVSGFSGKVVKFTTNSNGNTFTGNVTILSGIPVAPSHHVHEITRGPDGKLYLSTGDADNGQSQNVNVNSGKILRFNDDGSIPSDNPIAGKYFYAGGFRNPFGTAWRPGTNELWVTNNGPDEDDGIYVVNRGNIFGWCCNTSSGTWHLWHDTTAPVQNIFNPGNSGFPQESTGALYVALSGSTYSQGPSPNSKRIVEFRINPDGSKKNVSDLVTYTGGGYGAPIGVVFGSDGLYFTDIYGELGFTGVGVTKGNIYKVVVGNSSVIPPSNTTFSASLSPARWYPQGLNVIWECKSSGGSGQFSYDYFFGDGAKQLNTNSNNVYHHYPQAGTYSASCIIHDLSNSQSATASTSITLQN